MEAYIREEFDEIRKIMKETEAERKKSGAEFSQRLKASEEEREQAERERKKSGEEFYQRLKASEEERKKAAIERKQSELDFNRRMKKLSTLVGNYGSNQGDIAEDFFYRTLQCVKRLGSIEFDEVARNIHNCYQGEEGEYDVVLYNGDCVGLVEIKSKLHPKDIEKFVTVDLPKFKVLFPQMKNFRIYGAVAGMSIPSEVQELAEKEGLFVLTQAQEQLVCANTPDFQERVF